MRAPLSHTVARLLVCAAAALWITLGASASPIAPRMPSTLNFQSLNTIPVPTNEADWQFEITHLDMAIASGHLAGHKQRGSDVYLLQYVLCTWLETNDPELDQLRNFCAANGYDFENCFLHYYDDTRVPLGTGDTGDTLIRGWGGGTAATRAEARVRCNPWDHEAYVLNPADPGLRAYMRWRSDRYVHQAAPEGGVPADGLMVDTINPRTDAADLLEAELSGGRVIEFGNRTRRDPAAISWWNDNVCGLLAAANEGMGHDHPVGDRIILPNIAEYTFTSATRPYISAADGALTELWVTEAQPREPAAWDLAAWCASQAKYLVFSQVSYLSPVSSLGAGNYYDAQDRHQMFGLSSYWMAKQGNWIYYQQKRPPSGHPLYWTALSQWWVRAREYDIGQPLGPYQVWQQGTDSAGQQYTIYSREYSKALVLFRPKVGWTYSDYNARSQVYPLPGEFRLLHSDGTLGPPITSIALAMAEGAVLIRQQGGISLEKSVDKPSARPGETVTYSITWRNLSASKTYSGVRITDVLPTSCEFVSADSGGTHSDGTVTWTIGSAPPGASGTVGVTARIR